MLVWIILASFAISAQTAPPKEENKREADLLELVKLDKTIKLDIRYARTDNFVGKAVYTEARAFLQRPAAEAVDSRSSKTQKTKSRFGDFRRLSSVGGDETFLGSHAAKTNENSSPIRKKVRATIADVRLI